MNLSESELQARLRDIGIESAIVIPTRNGLQKAVLDATEPIRALFKAAGLHDYSKQAKGQGSKIKITAWLLRPGKSERTSASLYRPETKNGDPRFWIRGLPAFCEPGEAVGLACRDGELFAFLIKNHLAVDEIARRMRTIVPASASQAGTQNAFVEQLLALQQDGAGAISAPSSWSEPPLLEVKRTRTYRSAEAMLEWMLRTNHEPRWHFFVGSPGNGKSVATGHLVRSLVSNGWSARDLNGADVLEMAKGSLPVAIRLTPPNEEDFALLVVQDASVVTDPYTSDPNPSRDLLASLSEALDKRASVWVCVNRGILDQAQSEYGDGRLAQLLAAVSVQTNGAEMESRTLDDEQLMYSWDALDAYSLIHSADQEFDQLLSAATAEEKWEGCEPCESRDLCPFLANATLLRSEEGRSRLLRVVGDAELLGMQPVVFREAQALVSLLLAGVPSDYRGKSPCSWVHECRENREMFALGARRLPVMLFAANDPTGLHSEGDLGIEPVELADSLLVQAKTGLRIGANTRGLSTNVGLQRLLGRDGLLTRLDPFNGPIGEHLLDWETTFCPDSSAESTSRHVGALEKELERSWSQIERYFSAAQSDPRHAAFLLRWRSAVTMRFGAFMLGDHWFAEELSEFRRAVELQGTLTEPERDDLAADVQEMLRQGSTGVPVSTSAELTGPWVESELPPQLRPSSGDGVHRLTVQFNAGAPVAIGTEAFCWLRYRRRSGLTIATMPEDIVAAARLALQRAAAQGHYSRSVTGHPRRVILTVRLTDGTKLQLIRYGADDVNVRTLQ